MGIPDSWGDSLALRTCHTEQTVLSFVLWGPALGEHSRWTGKIWLEQQRKTSWRKKVVHGPAFEGGAGLQPMKKDGEDESERRSSVVQSVDLGKI